MKNKKKYRFLYYIAVVLFLAYFVITSIPNLQTDDNKIYFKILFMIPFFILIFYGLLKKKEK